MGLGAAPSSILLASGCYVASRIGNLASTPKTQYLPGTLPILFDDARDSAQQQQPSRFSIPRTPQGKRPRGVPSPNYGAVPDNLQM